MTLGLLSLPDECLSIVFSFLKLSEVRLVALTLNHRLFKLAACDVNRYWSKIKADEAYIESVLGRIRLGAETKSEKLSRYFAYLDLSGDLTWLEKRERFIPDCKDEDWWDVEATYVREPLDALIRTTTKLGLTLPSVFIKIYSQNVLHRRAFEPCGEPLLTPLCKLKVTRSAIDHSGQPIREVVEGYILSFWQDQQGTRYHNLYLDKAGRHAILPTDSMCVYYPDEERCYSPDELEKIKPNLADLTEEEKLLGVGLVLPCVYDYPSWGYLMDTNYEHWIQDGGPGMRTETMADRYGKKLGSGEDEGEHAGKGDKNQSHVTDTIDKEEHKEDEQGEGDEPYLTLN